MAEKSVAFTSDECEAVEISLVLAGDVDLDDVVESQLTLEIFHWINLIKIW